MITPPTVVALVGKLGHGKTLLLNKVAGTSFLSNMGARSCTRTLQFGYSRQNRITVVDTPGFCASDDVAAHIAAQKLALEGTALSGIYHVVKYGRSDEIAELLSKTMNFIGSDDIRIIITYGDTVRDQEGYNPNALKADLSSMLDVPVNHIVIVGRDTMGQTVENFIASTLHEPREFQNQRGSGYLHFFIMYRGEKVQQGHC